MNNPNHTTPVDLSRFADDMPKAWWKKLNLIDVVFALATLSLFAFGALKTWHLMDYYEVTILICGALVTVALAWFWRPLQAVFTCVALLSVSSVLLYQGQLSRGETVFGLKYMLASQPAVMWMSVLFVLSTLTYWVNVFLDKSILTWLATRLAYAALIIGFTALMVRWHESYLIAVDVGHIPVSNLYEVFILFSLLTTAFYLYYENHYKTTQLGAYVMLVVCMAVGFLLWYSVARGAHEIKPLIPALQSWWMKIHVPANFIGYGTFSLAAMVGFAYLIKYVGTPYDALPAAFRTNKNDVPPADLVRRHAQKTRIATIVLWVLGAALFVEPLLFRTGMNAAYFSTYWAIYFAIGLTIVGAILMMRRHLAAKLPDFEVLDDIMYKSIAMGFVFFTIATILGALWAADAWGKYWSWDPKETWALVVWLNYAAWLHLRLVAGLRGTFSAYWALIGLLITGFAFLGVNIFLSGLHSYGGL
ncbi:c-type cytochrome biogenesis protein CcsB [Hydromonas duriensis]|uniref:Cytochrome c-type biogenesis protein CcsB n=1 Tax=Hydromonas duriensis TaxID=1527608 RepID=A0A4R6Y9P4_9BURK|nr:c-type cytochrome biogenesis protein CcsB [Hydromonas duriensis]TDR32184.1 cytochrome c-type biogenesis protein CcsB [Hydromonas duriensis]